MSNTVLKIENLTVNYGRNTALRNVCLQLGEGEVLGIIGPNGGGKTTLLKAILGIIEPSEGRVELFGKSPEQSAHLIGYVPQHAEFDKNFPINVIDTVLMGCVGKGIHPFFTYSKNQRAAALEALRKVGIEQLASRRISELSGGQFQRMLIARAIVSSPKILFLDEPTASVDPASREQIYSLLGELKKDMAIVIVSHDLLAISSLVESLACLNGTLVYHGKPELTHEIVDELYGCPVELIAHGVPHRVLHTHSHSEEDSH